MGSALARAVCRVEKTKVYISDNNSAKIEAFSKEYGAFVSNNSFIARECDFIFLGVKPAALSALIPSILAELEDNKGAVIVSMAAGVAIDKITSLIGYERKIIRIMPNTPVAVGAGMICWCASSAVKRDDKIEFLKILSYAGKLDEIDERLIDAASAVSGCGPAFVYMFIEALSDGAVKCGLPRDKAMAYAAETLKGAAEMVLQTKEHPGVLKDAVCSPGGSTIEGVRALEEGSFRATSAEAVIAAYEKTKKLGK